MDWMPVEVALPWCDGQYIITTEVAGLGLFTKLAKYTTDKDLPTWYRDSATGYPENAETECEKVVAWMGWPAPFNGLIVDDLIPDAAEADMHWLKGSEVRCGYDELETIKGHIEPKKNAPVVHGRYKYYLWFMTCSECGMSLATTDDEGQKIPQNYCPNCGAKMDGEPTYDKPN